VVFPKPMAGTVSSANGTISEDASTEDIWRPINAHMTARREVAAMPNVIAADVAMPIETSDNPLAVAQVEEWMRVGREGDEEQDGNVKALVARRSSERLRERGRAPTLGCSEFRATQKRSRISRSFSEGAKGTGEAFFANSPADNEHEEAADLLQNLTDALPQSTHNPPLEELTSAFMTQINYWFGDELDTDHATRLLLDKHCNLDEALEAYRRHLDRLKKTVSTPKLPNTASPAQSTSETGVHGAIGLQRGRLSPKSIMSDPVVTLKEPNEQQNLRDWINEICTMRLHYLKERDSATPPHLRKFSPLLDIQLIESLSEAERAGMDARTPMLSFFLQE
jgi:hypothetical protein